MQGIILPRRRGGQHYADAAPNRTRSKGHPVSSRENRKRRYQQDNRTISWGSFYALADTGAERTLLELYAEEAVNKKGEVFTRAYELKDMEIVATSANGVLSREGGLTDAGIATAIHTVSNLFEAVKSALRVSLFLLCGR